MSGATIGVIALLVVSLASLFSTDHVFALVAVVLFPTLQGTEAGELAWIGEEEGEGEDESPAPRLTLVADPNATATTASPGTP